MLYLYYLLLSHFYIIVFSSRVCTCWSAFDRPWFFSIRAWGDLRATVRRNPGRLPGVSPTFLVLCILVFCLGMMSRCQNCIFFYFFFVIFQILYPDKNYCRCMSFMWNEIFGCLLYICARIWLHYYSVRYSRKRFSSSWVSAGHRHVPIFCILGSRTWHGFVGIRARFILIPHHIKTIRFTYKASITVWIYIISQNSCLWFPSKLFPISSRYSWLKTEMFTLPPKKT